MFQQTPVLCQLAPRVGLFETVDKLSVKSHLNSDANNIGNLCLSHRDPPLMLARCLRRWLKP